MAINDSSGIDPETNPIDRLERAVSDKLNHKVKLTPRRLLVFVFLFAFGFSTLMGNPDSTIGHMERTAGITKNFFGGFTMAWSYFILSNQVAIRKTDPLMVHIAKFLFLSAPFVLYVIFNAQFIYVNGYSLRVLIQTGFILIALHQLLQE